jgi:hypothetical protein
LAAAIEAKDTIMKPTLRFTTAVLAALGSTLTKKVRGMPVSCGVARIFDMPRIGDRHERHIL